MATCKNRAWQAAQSLLICKQGVVGSSPIISTAIISTTNIRRLEALGATRWDHQQERGFDFWVMRDPWSNEFCVLQPNFPELLARRRPWPT